VHPNVALRPSPPRISNRDLALSSKMVGTLTPAEAAAERARLRQRAALVEQGLLDDEYFEETHARRQDDDVLNKRGDGSRGDHDAEEDELMRDSGPSVELAQRKPKVRRLHGDDHDEDDEDGEGEEDQNQAGNRDKSRKASERVTLQAAQKDYDEDELLRLQLQDQSSVPLTAFNMKEEERSGTINANLEYVRSRRDDDDEEDDNPWLQSLKDQPNAIANKRPSSFQTNPTAKRKKDKDPRSYVQTLVNLLISNESVLQALRRFKDDKPKLLQVTDAASELLPNMPRIYENTREELDRLIEPERTKRMKSTYWEYRLSMDVGAEVHGPFSALELQEWRDQGYFGEDQQVYMRACNKPSTDDISSPSSKRQKTEEKPKSAAEELEADFSDDEDEGEAQNATQSNAGARANQGPDSSALSEENSRSAVASWVPSSTVVFTNVFEEPVT